jgi:putative PIN family toxin of toxin-antitoxin system
MIRVVIDTSVLVSAVISPTGPNAQIFELIADGKLLPDLTDAVLDEYYKVFEYKHLEHLDRRRIARLVGRRLQQGQIGRLVKNLGPRR